MRLKLDIDPDIVAMMAAEMAAGERAVTAAMREAGTGLKSAWRTQITGAGLGRRLANSIRNQNFPRSGESLDAAALVWSKAPVIVGAHDTGPLIRSKDGFWLAIPLPAAGLGLRGRRITPGEWERRRGLRLRFVYRRRGPSLLVGVTAKPTRDCEVLLPHIRTLIEDADSLKERLDATGMSGHLRMGAISTELGETIPYVLATLRSACPKLHLQVVPGTSQQLYEGLNLGTLDLAVTVRPDFALPKSRNVTVLKKQKHMLLTPRGMKGSLEEILEKHPFIRYDARSWGGEKLESYLRTLRIDRNILCDIDSLETIAVMVGNGMGVSVVPEWSGIDLHKFRLNKVQMAQEAGSREICVIHNLPAKLPKVIELITEICQTHASKTDT